MEINRCVDSGKYAEAIEMCKRQGKDDSSIRQIVEQKELEALEAFRDEKFELSLSLFVSIIGVSPASLFLSKFYKNELSSYVIRYLIEVHKQGYADTTLTTLLFDLFVPASARDDLNAFLAFIEGARLKKLQSERKVSGSNIKGIKSGPQPTAKELEESMCFFQHFDANAAIETLDRNNMAEEAARLANVIGISQSMIKALIERHFVDAATMILIDSSVSFQSHDVNDSEIH